MSTALKEKIIRKVRQTDDTSILEYIELLLDLEEEEEVLNLNNEQKKSIERGLKDLEKGKIYSEEESDRIFQKWLEK